MFIVIHSFFAYMSHVLELCLFLSSINPIKKTFIVWMLIIGSDIYCSVLQNLSETIIALVTEEGNFQLIQSYSPSDVSVWGLFSGLKLDLYHKRKNKRAWGAFKAAMIFTCNLHLGWIGIYLKPYVAAFRFLKKKNWLVYSFQVVVVKRYGITNKL